MMSRLSRLGLKPRKKRGTSKDFRSPGSQRADKVRLEELEGWEPVDRVWGTAVCDFHGCSVLPGDQVCVSREHSKLRQSGCGGQ